MREDSDPVDMVIDPSIGNGILYVAGRGSDRIDAYPIAAGRDHPGTSHELHRRW